MLPADDASAGTARRFVARSLSGIEGADVREAAVLLTSELVTNAVRHAGGECVLVVDVDAGRVRIEIHDQASQRPILRRLAVTDQRGRGLALVDALARRWGSDPVAGKGKAVWFELDDD
ncbi:MAG: ATP-binding protein [Acidimicrobiales bacterium]